MPVTYSPPVSLLLTLGEAPFSGEWRDYRELGLGEEHIPVLTRMVTDPALHQAPQDSAEVWAPVHAWRALGQLRAVEAAEPLAALLEQDDDWTSTELPRVFEMIGRPALPVLTTFLADISRGPWARGTAAESLQRIAQSDPSARGEVVSALAGQLEKWWRHDPILNALLIDALVELQAVEAAPLMEQAFAGERVDLMLRGDWEDIQVDLGLLPARTTPRAPLERDPELAEVMEKLTLLEQLGRAPGARLQTNRKIKQERQKAKRKAAKQARRRNRRGR